MRRVLEYDRFVEQISYINIAQRVLFGNALLTQHVFQCRCRQVSPTDSTRVRRQADVLMMGCSTMSAQCRLHPLSHLTCCITMWAVGVAHAATSTSFPCPCFLYSTCTASWMFSIGFGITKPRDLASRIMRLSLQQIIYPFISQSLNRDQQGNREKLDT